MLAMNEAIGKGLVAGEVEDVSSSNLGMRTQVIDSDLLAAGGSTGYSIAVQTSTSNGLSSGVQPNMLLPSTMNISADVTVAAINYGKNNPYELVGGELAVGASVNSFSFNGVKVADLDDPIVLALPLPSSRRRLMQQQQQRGEGAEQDQRQLSGTWNGTWSTKGIAASYSVDCGAENVSRLVAQYTAQDLARAQYCGTESLLENETKWVSYLEPWRNASKYVWCEGIQEWYYMDCEGRRGVINYTCPVYYPVSTCTYWDTAALTWSSEGCTYWRTDLETGVAYCNCTHLTSFTSDHTEELQSSTSTLTTTMSRSTSLTAQDVRKNIGVLIFILAIWGTAGLFYTCDKLMWRWKLMSENISDDGYRAFMLVRTAFHPERRAAKPKGDMSFLEQLQKFKPRASGTLFSMHPDQQKAQEEIEVEARSLMRRLRGKTKIWANWKDKMYQDHNVAALINPSSYERDAFAKRTIKLLFNILSLLFLMCLFAPLGDGYICPQDDTPGGGGGGLLPAIPRGISFVDMLLFILLQTSTMLVNLIWLEPPRRALHILLRSWM